MFEVNFILIEALIELLQRKISLKYIYICIYQGDPSCLCDTVTSFFHHVTQDKETRPTGTICSVNARLLPPQGLDPDGENPRRHPRVPAY